MIHIHNIEQNSEEWFEFRKGKLTGSNATCIGANGKGLETYCKSIARDLCNVTQEEQYISKDMERGNELEDYAAQAYEFEKGMELIKVGCITNDDFESVSISPDRLIGNEGGAEIKSRNNAKHFDLIIGDKGDIPINQIQMCLLVSGRKWWDFVSYNPNFDKPLYVERFYPDLKYFEKLKAGFETGRNLIKKYIELYQDYK